MSIINSTDEKQLVALTIAGFDPSGGAGVIADIKTFNAFGLFATAAVTSLTFQNTNGVYGAAHQTADTVARQIKPVIDDFVMACVKTGMLPTREIIETVARLFDEKDLLPAPVVDPVVRSTSGYDLIDDAALQALIKDLMPRACLVTPNIPEAERITKLKIRDENDMLRAARRLREMGARAALVKGGHLDKEKGEARSEKVNSKAEIKQAVDLLFDENGTETFLRGEWIETTSTHGTGCTLAAAIACGLGAGQSLLDAVTKAKLYVTEALRTAPGLGHGNGPIR